MIEQVRELLKGKNVSVAVIVDDAYDTTPTADDLVAARWSSFFDDISEEEEQRIRELVGPTYDELDAPELAKSDGFVQALWSLQALIGPARDIFAVYHTTQSRKRQVLEPLVRLLSGDLAMTCHQVGREVSLPELGGQVIFLDLYMGFVEVNAAMKRAASRVRELIDADPSAPPSIILLSQSSDIEKLAPKLRDDAEILGCQFRWISKNVLKDPAFVAENIYDLVASHADAVTLNAFIMSWDKALDVSRKSFMRNIRSLDLADYANVSSLILESEGEPLGDYVLDIYDLHLHSLIEGDVELAKAAKKLTTIDWKKNYPPAQFMPSEELVTLMDGALFHNQVRTDSYFGENRIRTPRLGEVFLEPAPPRSAVRGPAIEVVAPDEPIPAALAVTPDTKVHVLGAASDAEPTEAAEGTKADKTSDETAKPKPQFAYVVLSQACDLQHGESDRILLLRGEAEPYSWAQHDRSAKLRTPIMRVDKEEYSIEWDTLSPETWLLTDIEKRLNAGVRRARTFRMPFALQIQQAFIGKLGRVGTLANLPTRYAAGIKIYAKATDETATLLLETTAAESQAVCLVGRTGKGKLMEWLLLSASLKEKLRVSLQDVDTEKLYKETPGLRDFKTDPSFLRALSRGLLVDRTDKGRSRPLKDTPFDIVHILTRQKLAVGEPVKGLKGLVFEIDFSDPS
ncbi:MAG: hypothetical protein JWQ49_2974 [Edaphobacter sp.]|nr:hypothetical protein [Edaphobacter sp.]